MHENRHRSIRVLTRAWSYLRLRPDHCRDCGKEVGGFTEICPSCGQRAPVKLPAWIGMIIAGLGANSLLDMVVC